MDDKQLQIALSDRADLLVEVERLRTAMRQFYVAYGPHLPQSWRDHFDDALGEKMHFGLRDVGK